MKRPLASKRPLGPFFSSQYNQENIRQFKRTVAAQKASIDIINSRERELEAINTSGKQVQFILRNVGNRRSKIDEGSFFSFNKIDSFIGEDKRNRLVTEEGKPVIGANINQSFDIFTGVDKDVPGLSRDNIVIFEGFNSLAEAPSNNITKAESINIQLNDVKEVQKDLPGSTREITTTVRDFKIEVEGLNGSDDTLTAENVRFGNSRFNPEIVNTEVTIRRFNKDSELGVVKDGKDVFVVF